MHRSVCLTLFLAIVVYCSYSQGFNGYYQYPAIHGNTIVFTAEGDLWTVPATGGTATRLTTHPGEETHPIVSPDGKTIAFTATYEGPPELYTMPVQGGLPRRWTYEEEASTATAWDPAGRLVYTTTHFSTLPERQLVRIDLTTVTRERLPLEQASEAAFDGSGKTVFFVRPGFHGNVTKRYKGGTARKIWKYTEGSAEAVQLSDSYRGESHHPMWWNNRVYFITDRDSIMNIWSMNGDGKDLKQHTRQTAYDVRYATLNQGRIVYHVGADLWLYDIASGKESLVPVTLTSDLDQRREKWVTNPQEYITSVHPDPSGNGIVITARGRVFVAPARDGRLVQLSRKQGVRYRDAVFSHDGKDIITLTDESGEFEFVRIPATGVGTHQRLTGDGRILRFGAAPSPDGRWFAYGDLNNDLWLYNCETKAQKKISTNREGIGSMSWSPDSKWLAFTQNALNTFEQVHIFDISKGASFELTTDRANSFSPAWSADGNWIYFLSDRNFESLVGSPWGPRQPEPYFDRQVKVYQVALRKGLRSPFRAADELYSEPEKKDNSTAPVTVVIDPAGIQQRLSEVPLKPGNYHRLSAGEKALYFLSDEAGLEGNTHLMAFRIGHTDKEATRLAADVAGYELSANRKKLMIRKDRDYYLAEAGTSPIDKLNDAKVDLKGWSFAMDPVEDWKQIFTDAWRMERDYFYDVGMHGLDWKAMHAKYYSMIDRITTRSELSDLMGQFVGELSVLHTAVRDGDLRTGNDKVTAACLGARFSKVANGFRIDYIYKSDPDYPDDLSPLAQPDMDVAVGDVITQVNGDAAASASDINQLIRNKADKQVRISVLSPGGRTRDLIVTPTSDEPDLRYDDWEYTRRLEVEKKGEGKIGYVHLRAMGSSNISEWYREFYPVFNRQGLIIDARTNRGGNIEAFILEKLMRKAWMYWKGRVGEPYWNMHYAFRGHMTVLVNHNTASDGEAFADGFRRLGLGKVIGTRTWGGEVWLGDQNRLSDRGIARTPMTGVYGPERQWLIEGVGLIPDIEVDNLPHATFLGQDAQLDAAIRHLQDLIKADPRTVPAPPVYPDKALKR
jgi:tricorn protease